MKIFKSWKEWTNHLQLYWSSDDAQHEEQDSEEIPVHQLRPGNWGMRIQSCEVKNFMEKNVIASYQR